MDASRFWSWFQSQRHRLLRFRSGTDEPFLDEIQSELHHFCEHLWFEIGGHPSGPLEFIVSAEGNSEYFEQVNSLVSQAPRVEGIEIIAFKQPQGFDFVTNYDGAEIDPSMCWFLPLISQQKPGLLALRVGVPAYGLVPESALTSGLYIVVETGLGELVAEQRIAFIEPCELPANPEKEGFLPLPELADYISWHSRQTDV
jgi:hypothetical protein